MKKIKLSSKYQISIPKEIRERCSLKSGQEFEVLAYNGRIQLIPIKPINKLAGFLKGKDPSFIREKTERF